MRELDHCAIEMSSILKMAHSVVRVTIIASSSIDEARRMNHQSIKNKLLVQKRMNLTLCLFAKWLQRTRQPRRAAKTKIYKDVPSDDEENSKEDTPEHSGDDSASVETDTSPVVKNKKSSMKQTHKLARPLDDEFQEARDWRAMSGIDYWIDLEEQWISHLQTCDEIEEIDDKKAQLSVTLLKENTQGHYKLYYVNIEKRCKISVINLKIVFYCCGRIFQRSRSQSQLKYSEGANTIVYCLSLYSFFLKNSSSSRNVAIMYFLLIYLCTSEIRQMEFINHPTRRKYISIETICRIF